VHLCRLANPDAARVIFAPGGDGASPSRETLACAGGHVRGFVGFAEIHVEEGH
jgi:hypothetical protein